VYFGKFLLEYIGHYAENIWVKMAGTFVMTAYLWIVVIDQEEVCVRWVDTRWVYTILCKVIDP